MVELSELLIDLIFKQKSASVPELGTFEFVANPARIHFGENVIFPPSQQLVFTDSKEDAGEVSFTEFLVQEKGFDEHEALIRVKAYVHKIKENLDTLGYSYLPGLGTLHRSEDAQMEFTPGDKIKAMKPTLGLPEINVEPIAREYVNPESLVEEAEKTVAIQGDEDDKKQRKSWVLPVVLAFVLLGLGIAGYFLYKMQSNTDQTSVVNQTETQSDTQEVLDDQTSNIPSTGDNNLNGMSNDGQSEYQPDDAVTDNTIPETNTSVVPKTEPSPENASPASEEPVKQTKTKEKKAVKPLEDTPHTGKGCAVIVGVMSKPENARRLAQVIKKAGFEPFSYTSKGLTRVGASCNCDDQSIDSTLRLMKKINADAWIYESE